MEYLAAGKITPGAILAAERWTPPASSQSALGRSCACEETYQVVLGNGIARAECSVPLHSAVIRNATLFGQKPFVDLQQAI